MQFLMMAGNRAETCSINLNIVIKSDLLATNIAITPFSINSKLMYIPEFTVFIECGKNPHIQESQRRSSRGGFVKTIVT